VNAVLKPRVEISEEQYTEALYEEALPLARLQWEEIANYRELIPLSPRKDVYLASAKAGHLLFLTARFDGVLIGYAIFFIVYTAHYGKSLFAVNDIIYVLPEYRKGSVGVRLVKESERETKKRGAMLIRFHCKLTNDFASLLDRLGYNTDEISKGKLL
jgi:GNAT superfamily N-acetyltransferase